MHKALHPRDDKDRLYVSRKEGGRGFANIEDCVETTIQQLEDYTRKSKDRLLMAVNNSRCGIWTNRKTTRLENKNGKTNNYMDTSNDKTERLHMKKPGHG